MGPFFVLNQDHLPGQDKTVVEPGSALPFQSLLVSVVGLDDFASGNFVEFQLARPLLPMYAKPPRASVLRSASMHTVGPMLQNSSAHPVTTIDIVGLSHNVLALR